MVDQLDDYFRAHFHPFLSAYRKGYSCQSPLLALTEDWRQSLDGGHIVGAILMDLSKAFDCLPHSLLNEKLRAYNLAESAVSLLGSYLFGQGAMCEDRKRPKCFSPYVQRCVPGFHNWPRLVQHFHQRQISLYSSYQTVQLC